MIKFTKCQGSSLHFHENVRIIEDQLPMLKYYTDHLGKKKLGLMHQLLTDLSRRNQVKFLNHLSDRRFSEGGFPFLPDHLNAIGAEKISKILNREIMGERGPAEI